MDIDAERVRISKEIRELERILDPGSSSVNVDVSESSLDSGPDAGQCLRSLVREAVSALGLRSAAVCRAAGQCVTTPPRQPLAPLAVCEHPAPWCSRLSWEEGPCCPPQQSEGSRARLAPVLEQSPPLRPHRSLPWAQAAALCPRALLPGLLFCPLRVLSWALSVPPRSSGWRPACGG